MTRQERCAWISPKGWTCLRTHEEHAHMERDHEFTTTEEMARKRVGGTWGTF